MRTEASHRDTTAVSSASPHAKPFFARLPRYAYAGVALNGVAWIASWSHQGGGFVFFPLWLGFILLLDGLNVARRGTSPLARGIWRFVAMFLASSLFWWIFEGLNVPVQNWHYQLDQPYSPLVYFLMASLNFSTVLPAVMEVAELLMGTRALRPRLAASDPGPRLPIWTATALVGLGLVMLALPFFFPRYTFGLVWLCLIFLFDPINNLARRKSVFAHALARDWRFIVALPLAALICGFFWEMWNFPALPKWYYTIPFIDGGPHLFEMPIPGYLGYLPFAVELFAMYQLLLLVLGRHEDNLAF